jgi:hypothetical protein
MISSTFCLESEIQRKSSSSFPLHLSYESKGWIVAALENFLTLWVSFIFPPNQRRPGNGFRARGHVNVLIVIICSWCICTRSVVCWFHFIDLVSVLSLILVCLYAWINKFAAHLLMERPLVWFLLLANRGLVIHTPPLFSISCIHCYDFTHFFSLQLQSCLIK